VFYTVRVFNIMNTPASPPKPKRASTEIRNNQRRPGWSDPPNGSHRPNFFRLPRPGSDGDPYFHFSRSFYYKGEDRGYWQLVRIVEPGKRRGVTLVEYSAVERFVRSKMEAANNT
jgi:hypothetical protein